MIFSFLDLHCDIFFSLKISNPALYHINKAYFYDFFNIFRKDSMKVEIYQYFLTNKKVTTPIGYCHFFYVCIRVPNEFGTGQTKEKN